MGNTEKMKNIDGTEFSVLNIPEIELDGFGDNEARQFQPIISRFMTAYSTKGKEIPVTEWLFRQLSEELPEKNDVEIQDMVKDIIDTVDTFNHNMSSLNEACDRGKTKEQWFSETMKDAASGISLNQYGNYLAGIDEAISTANEAMYHTISTQGGAVSQNHNLDGFIAEQHHVNTFNRDAALKNSNLRAVRLDRPEGGTFGKNSVDVEIYRKDTGKVLRRYQVKYYKNAEGSVKAMDPKRYGNQQGIIPKGQKTTFERAQEAGKGYLPKGSKKTINEYIGDADKGSPSSDPLSKKQAEHYRDASQKSGRTPDKMSWNQYNTQELALHLGKQAAFAGMSAAAISTGFDLAYKIMDGEEVKGKEVIREALKTGADTEIKAAAAGALKVGVEKGLVPMLSKTSPVTAIACVAIENIKTLGRFAKGELSATQTLDYMGRSSVAMVAGMGCAAEGAAIGAAALAIIPVIGPVIGGFIGGVVGYIAGSQVGQAVYKGAKKIAKTAVSAVKAVGGAICRGAKAVGGAICRGFKAIASLF